MTSNIGNNGIFALFPGQGSQHVGMAKDLFENFKGVRETFEEASDAVGKDLKKLCFEGPENELVLTENTQPCLLLSSVAAFRVAESELGVRPTGVAGHSLGEYSALVAAGALPLATAIRWVRERGKAMQLAVPAGQGTMAAILNLASAESALAESELIAQLCEKATASARAKRSSGESSDLTVEAIVQPANFNSPGQIVIAGSTDAVAEAVTLVKSGDGFSGKAIPLSVSAPFHCKLMAPARDRMAELFSQATEAEKPKTMIAPYVPNRTARPTQEIGLVFELLVEQVDHPVLWKQSMEAVLQSGATRFVEFGPGKVLAGLMKRISQSSGKTVELFSMADTASLKTLETAVRK